MVFANFIASVVASYLGGFLKGISNNSISVSLFKGSIQIKDAEIVPINIPNVPLRIASGTIGSITVSIPWRSIFSQICRIEVRDICLLITTDTNLTEHNMDLETKLKLLDFFKASQQVDNNESATSSLLHRALRFLINYISLEVSDCAFHFAPFPQENRIPETVVISIHSLNCEATKEKNKVPYIVRDNISVSRIITFGGVNVELSQYGDELDNQHTNPDCRLFYAKCNQNKRFLILDNSSAVQQLSYTARTAKLPEKVECSVTLVPGKFHLGQENVERLIKFTNCLLSSLCPHKVSTPRSRWAEAIASILNECRSRRERCHFVWSSYIKWKKLIHDYYLKSLSDLDSSWTTRRTSDDCTDAERLLSYEDLIECRRHAQYTKKKYQSSGTIEAWRPFSHLAQMPLIDLSQMDDSVRINVHLSCSSFPVSLEGILISFHDLDVHMRKDAYLSVSGGLSGISCDVNGGSNKEPLLSTAFQGESPFIFYTEVDNSLSINIKSVELKMSESSLSKLERTRNHYNCLFTEPSLAISPSRKMERKTKFMVTVSVANALLHLCDIHLQISNFVVDQSTEFVSADEAILSVGIHPIAKMSRYFLQTGKCPVLVRVSEVILYDHLEGLERLKSLLDSLGTSQENEVTLGDNSNLVQRAQSLSVELDVATIAIFSSLQLHNVNTKISTEEEGGWRVAVTCLGVQSGGILVSHTRLHLTLWCDSMLSQSPFPILGGEGEGVAFEVSLWNLNILLDSGIADEIEGLYDFVNLLMFAGDDAHIYLREGLLKKPQMCGRVTIHDSMITFPPDASSPDDCFPLVMRGDIINVHFDRYADKRTSTTVALGDTLKVFLDDAAPIDLFPSSPGGSFVVTIQTDPPDEMDLADFPFQRLSIDVKAVNRLLVAHVPTIMAVWTHFNNDSRPLWRVRSVGSRVHFSNRKSRNRCSPPRTPNSTRHHQIAVEANRQSTYGATTTAALPEDSSFAPPGFPSDLTITFTASNSTLLYPADAMGSVFLRSHVPHCRVSLMSRSSCLRVDVVGQFFMPLVATTSEEKYVLPVQKTKTCSTRGTTRHSDSNNNLLHGKVIYTSDSRPPFHTGTPDESLHISVGSGCGGPMRITLDADQLASWVALFTAPPGGAETPSPPPPPPRPELSAEAVASVLRRRLISTIFIFPFLLHIPSAGVVLSSVTEGIQFRSSPMSQEWRIPAISLLFNRTLFGHTYDLMRCTTEHLEKEKGTVAILSMRSSDEVDDDDGDFGSNGHKSRGNSPAILMTSTILCIDDQTPILYTRQCVTIGNVACNVDEETCAMLAGGLTAARIQEVMDLVSAKQRVISALRKQILSDMAAKRRTVMPAPPPSPHREQQQQQQHEFSMSVRRFQLRVEWLSVWKQSEVALIFLLTQGQYSSRTNAAFGQCRRSLTHVSVDRGQILLELAEVASHSRSSSGEDDRGRCQVPLSGEIQVGTTYQQGISTSWIASRPTTSTTATTTTTIDDEEPQGDAEEVPVVVVSPLRVTLTHNQFIMLCELPKRLQQHDVYTHYDTHSSEPSLISPQDFFVAIPTDTNNASTCDTGKRDGEGEDNDVCSSSLASAISYDSQLLLSKDAAAVPPISPDDGREASSTSIPDFKDDTVHESEAAKGNAAVFLLSSVELNILDVAADSEAEAAQQQSILAMVSSKVTGKSPITGCDGLSTDDDDERSDVPKSVIKPTRRRQALKQTPRAEARSVAFDVMLDDCCLCLRLCSVFFTRPTERRSSSSSNTTTSAVATKVFGCAEMMLTSAHAPYNNPLLSVKNVTVVDSSNTMDPRLIRVESITVDVTTSTILPLIGPVIEIPARQLHYCYRSPSTMTAAGNNKQANLFDWSRQVPSLHLSRITTAEWKLDSDLFLSRGGQVLFFSSRETNHLDVDMNGHCIYLLDDNIEEEGSGEGGGEVDCIRRDRMVMAIEDALTVTFRRGTFRLPLRNWSVALQESVSSNGVEKALLPFVACGEGSYIQCDSVRLGFSDGREDAHRQARHTTTHSSHPQKEEGLAAKANTITAPVRRAPTPAATSTTTTRQRGYAVEVPTLAVYLHAPTQPRQLRVATSAIIRIDPRGGGDVELRDLSVCTSLLETRSTTANSVILSPTEVRVVCTAEGRSYSLSLGNIVVDVTRSDMHMFYALQSGLSAVAKHVKYLTASPSEREFLEVLDATLAWRASIDTHHAAMQNRRQQQQQNRRQGQEYTAESDEKNPSSNDDDDDNGERNILTLPGDLTLNRTASHVRVATFIPFIELTISDVKYPLLRAIVRDVCGRYDSPYPSMQTSSLQCHGAQMDVYGKGRWDTVLLPCQQAMVSHTQTISRHSSNEHVSAVLEGCQTRCSNMTLSKLLFAARQTAAVFQSESSIHGDAFDDDDANDDNANGEYGGASSGSSTKASRGGGGHSSRNATHRFVNHFNCTFLLLIGPADASSGDWFWLRPSASVDASIPYKRASELFVFLFKEDSVDVVSSTPSSSPPAFRIKKDGRTQSLPDLSHARVRISALQYGKATGLVLAENTLVVFSCADQEAVVAAAASGALGVDEGYEVMETAASWASCQASGYLTSPTDQPPLSSPSEVLDDYRGAVVVAAGAPPTQQQQRTALSSHAAGGAADAAGLVVVQVHAKMTLCNDTGMPLEVQQLAMEAEEGESPTSGRSIRLGVSGTGGATQDGGGSPHFHIMTAGMQFPLHGNCVGVVLRCSIGPRIYEAPLNILDIGSGTFVELPRRAARASTLEESAHAPAAARWDAKDDQRPVVFFVVARHMPESLSTTIYLHPRLTVINHMGVPIKVSLWQQDDRAGPQVASDASLLQPWVRKPDGQGDDMLGRRRAARRKREAFYGSLTPLCASDSLRHKHAMPIVQSSYKSNLVMGLSFSQCTGDTVYTEDLTEVVENLLDAVDHHPRLLTLRDAASGQSFLVQVSVLARTIIISVGVWISNLTEYPLLLTDSIVTRYLSAGQSSNTGIIPSQGAPFLIGCRLQDFTQIFFKIGLDGDWSEGIEVEMGASGGLESYQSKLGITRSCNYAIQLPNAQEGRPVVILITPRWMLLNNTTKRLRLFFDFPGIERAISDAQRASWRVQLHGDAIPDSDMTAIASVSSILLNPGEHHVSCVGTLKGNRLAVQEVLEGTVPTVSSISEVRSTSSHHDKQHQQRSISEYYSSQRTPFMSVDEPDQATFNLWAAPRSPGLQQAVSYGGALMVSRTRWQAPTDLAAHDPFSADAVVTGRITVTVENTENMLAVVLQPVRSTKIRIQNRTQRETVVVRQEGTRRRNVVAPRKNSFFLWEDSRGEHLIRVHMVGWKGQWFRVDFSGGDCRVSRHGNEDNNNNYSYNYNSSSAKGVQRLPFFVHGFTNAEKTQVTIMITDRDIPSYVLMGSWRTSLALSLHVSYFKFTWLREVMEEGTNTIIHHPQKLLSVGLEGARLDMVDTDDNRQIYFEVHQLQLVDEVQRCVFVYRARVATLLAPTLKTGASSSPFSEYAAPSSPLSPFSAATRAGSSSRPRSPMVLGLGVDPRSPRRRAVTARPQDTLGSLTELLLGSIHRDRVAVAHERELPCDIAVSYSAIKYADGMMRLSDVSVNLTALVVALSDTWLALMLHEARRLQYLLATAQSRAQGGDNNNNSAGSRRRPRVGATRTRRLYRTTTTTTTNTVTTTLESPTSAGPLTSCDGGNSDEEEDDNPPHATSPTTSSNTNNNNNNNNNDNSTQSRVIASDTGRRNVVVVVEDVTRAEFLPQQRFIALVLQDLQRYYHYHHATDTAPSTASSLHHRKSSTSHRSAGSGGGGASSQAQQQQALSTSAQQHHPQHQHQQQSSSIYYIESLHVSRITLYVSFARHKPDPLRPLLGAYTLMLPAALTQREFSLAPFSLTGGQAETLASLSARVQRWAMAGLRRQWTKMTKIGAAVDRLRWWRRPLPLRRAPRSLTNAAVSRLTAEAESRALSDDAEAPVYTAAIDLEFMSSSDSEDE